MNRKIVTIFFALLTMLMLSQCGQEGVTNISAEELQKKLSENPKLFVLDVRNQKEYSAGHIKGVKLIPVQELDNRYKEIEDKKNAEVYIICRSGNRSRAASGILVAKGFSKIFNVSGGMKSWLSNGFPTVK